MSQSVERQLRALYGSGPLIESGTVHVVHAARAADGLLHAVRVGRPSSPHSESDFFVLNLCRARADAVLTSAENLRQEPTLGHQLQGPWAGALERYRRQLGKSAPLVCAILTRRGELPEQHPFWRDGTDKLLLCPPAVQGALRARFATRARVVGMSGLSPRTAIEWLRQHHALVSVEAGPSTAKQLYEPPSMVDELLLTTWQGDPAQIELAGALAEDSRLFQGLSRAGGSCHDEAGERFMFERWTRTV